MRRTYISFLVAMLFCLGGQAAWAQLFGARQLGQPLQRRPGISMFSGGGGAMQGAAGAMQGNERFLRENRGRREFVGADVRENQGFVGSEQARTGGTIMSATAGLREQADAGARLNRPLQPTGNRELYHPRLTVAFDAPVAPPDEISQRLRSELETALTSGSRMDVSIVGRTAILRGDVDSAKDRALAELLVLFEPGISDVTNQLRVVTGQN